MCHTLIALALYALQSRLCFTIFSLIHPALPVLKAATDSRPESLWDASDMP